jgi:hypothetical protein
MHRVAAVMLLPLLNVLVFVLIQTAFIWYIGSNEVLNVVQKKADILSSARRIFHRTGHNVSTQFLDTLMKNAQDSITDWDRKSDTGERDARNWALVKTWVGPWVVCAGVLASVCAMILVRSPSHQFGPAQWMVGLPLIIVSYIGEILFFLFVVERYIIIGDFEVIRLLLGVTDPGMGYDDKIH